MHFMLILWYLVPTCLLLTVSTCVLDAQDPVFPGTDAETSRDCGFEDLPAGPFQECSTPLEIPLPAKGVQRLRFCVTSPPRTGVLVDSLRLTPALPQEIREVRVEPLTVPVLVGVAASPLMKFNVRTTGTLAPHSLQGIRVELSESTDLRDIDSLRLYYTGSDGSRFQSTTPVSPSIPATRRLVLSGDRVLGAGDNYFWVACKLNPTANLDHRIGITLRSASVESQEQLIDQETVWQRLGVALRKSGDDGVHTFRIPGLVRSNAGSLIAVYDMRHRGSGDLPGDIDVGMSRSTDGGRTWQPMQTIMDMGNDPAWNGDGIGDPSILVDRKTGTIWVAATWSHGNRSWNGSGPGLTPEQTGQLMLVSSHDDGVSWSQPINITRQVKQPAWSFLLAGPGKGITLSDGTLVFPAQYQDPPDANDKGAHRLPHATFIYSQDQGAHWQIATGAHDDTTESQIVELLDGTLMINARYNRENYRVVMTSDDLGSTWREHPTNRKSLVEPGSCMASLINVSRELGRSKTDWLLFSNPASALRRERITIQASPDLGQHWPAQQQLLLDELTGRGYSCLAMIDAETVGILYESSQADLVFQRIPLRELTGDEPATDLEHP